MKKVLVTLLVLLLIAASVMAMVACNNNKKPEPKPSDEIIKPLDPLTDYSKEAKYYNVVQPANYTQSDITTASNKLKAKQTEQKTQKETTGLYDDGTNWVENTTSFTKIFIYSDTDKIIDRFSKAGLPKDRMEKLVEYIVRDDRDSGRFNYIEGKTSAIKDYEELDELYDIYDKEGKKYVINGFTRNVNELVQLKRRKIMGELAAIFGTSGDQAARTAMEIILYAQEVVYNNMMPKYNNVHTNNNVTEEEYYKVALFDYETLVYMKAFNSFISDPIKTASGVYMTYTANVKKDIVKLYGYYYQYQKKDYDCFTFEQYDEYTKLAQKEYFANNAEAQKYVEYDRTHYAKAYRFSEAFYKDYYDIHLKFQAKQEAYDIEVYGIDAAFSTNSAATYSQQMRYALDNGRLNANLKMSDINYEYTGDVKNVNEYDTANRAYYGVNESYRNEYENNEYSDWTIKNTEIRREAIKYVNLQVIELKSQIYTINHKTLGSTGGINDRSLALQYQIYSFSADYIRNIQSYKKDNVILAEEIKRTTDASIIEEKQDTIGRNNIMRENLLTNYGAAAIDSQINKAKEADWSKISEEMQAAASPSTSYTAYHEANYNNSSATQVIEKFQNTLIKRVWKRGSETSSEPKSEAEGWTKEYDTNHSISHLLNNHEIVFRYANSQVKVTYTTPGSSINSFRLSEEKNEYKAGSKFTLSFSENKVVMSTNYDGSGTLSNSAEITARPAITNYSTFKTQTVKTDATPSIPFYSTTGNNWINDPYRIKDITPVTIKHGSVDYTYYFEFAGWFLDRENKYPVRPDDTFSFDVKLYPGFYITRVEK